MSHSKGRRILRAIAVWAPTILFAVLFCLAGVVKFTMSAMWSERLTGWGYPAGSTFVIGAVEILAAIALLAPRAAGHGAVTLGIVMPGTSGTHLIFTFVVASLMFTLAWFRLPGKRPTEPATQAS